MSRGGGGGGGRFGGRAGFSGGSPAARGGPAPRGSPAARGRPAPRDGPDPRGSAAPRPGPASSPPLRKARDAPPPAPVIASSDGSMGGGIGSTIAQGMAFGTGSAVAHRAVDAVAGPRTIQHEVVGSGPANAAPSPVTNSGTDSDACAVHNKAFLDCLNNYGSDISKCQFYHDMLSECRRSSGSVMGA